MAIQLVITKRNLIINLELLRRATVNAIANIAIEEDNILALGRCGALQLIFELIRINDKELLRGCIHTLANLTNAGTSRSRLPF